MGARESHSTGDPLDETLSERSVAEWRGRGGQRAPEAVEGLRGRAADLMKKALISGVGALFMTEEGIRNLVGELKLPKELIGSVLAQADRTKQEVLRVMTEELRSFLSSPVLHEEFLDLLTDATLEVKAEFRLRRSGAGLTPEVREEPRVSVRPTTRRRSKS
jgi:hypothetical protein